MRRSSTQIPSQIPRRSSSIDTNHYSSSQPQVLSTQTNIPGMGRHSSVGRASSIGRPSMSQSGKGGEKVINSQELANSIALLLDDLTYSPTVTAKILLVPSTQLFYQVFEWLLKSMGVADIWSPQLLANANPNENNNKNMNLNNNNNNQQNNPVAQHKAKIDLVLYHLQMFKYTNIPKATVLQTMTTPKNWIQMLLILHFLANDCLFVQTFDVHKIISSFESSHDAQILHEYLKKAHEHVTKNQKASPDYQIANDSAYHKMKLDALQRYADEFKAEENLKKLKNQLENTNKLHDYLKSASNDDQVLSNEEEELKKELAELENKICSQVNGYKAISTHIKANREEINVLTRDNQASEKELSLKEHQYEQQKSTCKDLDKIAKKHAQKFQELEALQSNYNDVETECDEFQKRLMLRTQEVKKLIQNGKEIIEKIKHSSSLHLEELPEISLVDFHKRNDVINKYKENIQKMREKYNADICKLPDVLLKLKEEKKRIGDKINETKSLNTHLEEEIKTTDSTNSKLQQENKVILADRKASVEELNEKLQENVKQLRALESELENLSAAIVKISSEKTRVDKDLKEQIDGANQKYMEISNKVFEHTCNTRAVNMQCMHEKISETDEFNESVIKFLNKKF